MKKHTCEHCGEKVTCGNKEDIQIKIDQHNRWCEKLGEKRWRGFQ